MQPRARRAWREYASGDDGGDAVGGIVESVQEVEGQGDQHGDDQQYNGARHRRFPVSLSSVVFQDYSLEDVGGVFALSVAVSRTSSNSLLFMRLIRSVSRSNKQADGFTRRGVGLVFIALISTQRASTSPFFLR